MRFKETREYYEQHLVRQFLRIRKLKVYDAIQQTIVILYPFMLVGSIMELLRESFLIKGSYFDELFGTVAMIPHANGINFSLGSMSKLTIGFAGVLAATEVARNLAKKFDKDTQMAGVTGGLAYLILTFYDSDQGVLGFTARSLGFSSLLFGILVGVITGYIFKYLSRKVDTNQPKGSVIRDRMFNSMWAITVTLVLFAGLNTVFYLLNSKALTPEINRLVIQNVMNTHSAWVLTGGTALSIILQFVGMGSPIANGQMMGADAVSNLNYALQHQSAWNIPNPINAHGIIGIYTNIGGTGATLGLLIAIIWVGKGRQFQRVAKQSLLPGLFNYNQSTLVGLPILFNIAYVIPFILAPIVNLLITMSALKLHLIPSAVYQIPNGTPGIFMGFIGTNGSVQALILSLVLVAMDVLIYVPFVEIGEKVNADLNQGGDVE